MLGEEQTKVKLGQNKKHCCGRTKILSQHYFNAISFKQIYQVEKVITVREIVFPKEDARNVPEIFHQNNISYHQIDNINWEKAFPYAPLVKFAIAHTQSAIIVHYIVKEKGVLGNVTRDLGDVWGDSCVEFLFAPENDGTYYNIECNCLGYILMGTGQERPNRIRLSADIIQKIKRWNSLGKKTIDYVEDEKKWEVALIIPYSVFVNHDISSIIGKTVKANFYKCGGKEEFKHYLTWNPINSSKPDFHRPECFGSLYFE